MTQSKTFFFKSFSKIAILPYIGGTIIHILRLIYNFPIEQAPNWIHWPIVILGSYATLGFIIYMRRIKFKGMLDKILYSLVIIHLGGSVILHTYSIFVSNEWMGNFSYSYSYFAVFYFVVLGLYCFWLSRRIDSL